MRGVSVHSQADLAERVEAAIDAGTDPGQLGAELFEVSGLLTQQVALRRAVTDPAASAPARSRLLGGLLSGKVSPAAAELSAYAAGLRWASNRDLDQALEYAGVIAEVSASERSGQAGELEDELFRFERIVAGDPELRDAVSDRAVPAAHRRELVGRLLGDRVSPPARVLSMQAVGGRHRSFSAAMAYFIKEVSERRQRFVATVHSATPLNGQERERLSAALALNYGRPVDINVVVDPSVIGGLRVELGDDVIDGTVASRLDDARRRLSR